MKWNCCVTGYSHFTFWWILPYYPWSNSCKLILSFQCAVGNSCQCTLVFIHYVYIKYKLVCLVLWKIESNEIKKSFFVKQSFIWKEKELVFCTCRVMGDPWLIALVKKETSYVIVTHYFLYQHQCINVEVPTNIIHLLLWNLSQLEILIEEILYSKHWEPKFFSST